MNKTAFLVVFVDLCEWGTTLSSEVENARKNISIFSTSLSCICKHTLSVYQDCTESVKSRQVYLVRFIRSTEEITVDVSQQSLCFMDQGLFVAQETVNSAAHLHKYICK